MRVPWHDQEWTGQVCADPLANSSCTLLNNIGTKRDDDYEIANAGRPVEQLDSKRLPCLTERAAFMSPHGYSVLKEHPYRFNRAFKDHILPTTVIVPGYAFESLPFRWLSSTPLREEIGLDQVPGYNPDFETAAIAAADFDNGWLMHGSNQRAAIDAFYEPVEPGDSLVFIYLKHSPLQEERTDKLLVGAARVAGLRKPPMWNQKGASPFPSSMWETIVSHTLRPDMADGILLPYQSLVPILDAGDDISTALAWAPSGRDLEFSYVTEHVSDDAALEALVALARAARALPALGLSVPAAALEWVEQQSARLWQLRGPVPGLASALGYLRVQRPYAATRAIIDVTPDDGDPWNVVDAGMRDPTCFPAGAQASFTTTVRRTWTALPALQRRALQVLSSFDISVDQVAFLMESSEMVGLGLDEMALTV
jgi:hypothetical protein